MSTNDQTLPADQEALRKIKAAAEARPGGDNFRVKIIRRNTVMGQPYPFATLDEATVEHLSQLETWMPDLLRGGGGKFELYVYHCSDLVTAVSMGAIRFDAEGPPQEPYLEAMKSKLWAGPRKLVAPRPKEDLGLTPLMPSGASHTSRDQQQVGGAPGGSLSSADKQRVVDDPNGAITRALALMDAVEKRSREVEQKQRETELAALRAESDAKTRAMEQRMELLIAKVSQPAPVAPTPPSLVDQMPALMAAATPIITALMESNKARAAIEAERVRAAEETNRQLLAQITALAAKPNGNDATHTQMAAAMSTMTSSMVQVLHTATELQNLQNAGVGEQSIWVQLAPYITKGIDSLAQMAQAGQKNAVGQGSTPTQAMPPRQQLPTSSSAHPVDRLVTMIRQHAPVRGVINTFFESTSDVRMQKALESVGGNPVVLLNVRLGDWMTAQENQGYMQALMEEFRVQAQSRGLLESQQQEENETETEDQGDDSEEEAAPEVEAAPEATA